MNRTKIEWVKNPDGTQGYTWNPITGCLNYINGLCKGGGFPCYAYKLANGRLFATYCHNTNLAPGAKGKFDKGEGWVGNLSGDYTDPFYPRFWPERLYHPWGGEPKGIFVCDMGELFGDWLPKEWVDTTMNLIRLHEGERYYLLTKQPQNLSKWSPFPDNCWVGVTATDPQMFHEAEMYLGKISATVKFISIEPMLERFWLAEILGIDWLIIGAQTKPYKPPRIEWVEEIVDAADRAGIPVFLKDNLKPLIQEAGMGRANWAAKEWVQCKYPSKYPILRQEMLQ